MKDRKAIVFGRPLIVLGLALRVREYWSVCALCGKSHYPALTLVILFDARGSAG
jgi:hypothetical protein